MSQNTIPNKNPATLKELLQAAAKPIMFILFLIMVCAFLAHYLVGSETLAEYARNHPEAAQGRADDAEGSTVSGNSVDAESSDAPQNSADAESSDAPQNSASPKLSGDSKNSDGSEHSADKDASDTSDRDSAYNTFKDIGSDADDGAKSDSVVSDKENDDMSVNADRVTCQSGFYYEPLSDSMKQKITGISYPESGCTVPYEDLNYVGLLYIDFNGEEQAGELICNKAIAQDMVEIFYELYQNGYQIERIRLIDEYDGDDTLSMMDNNTSCFNYRVVDGTTNLSKHALGCAIDINPFYNPYVVYNKDGSGETYISPKGSEIYTDRSQNFPYKIDENDLCYKLFTAHGFTWGGDWNSCKDYQHFQITLQ